MMTSNSKRALPTFQHDLHMNLAEVKKKLGESPDLVIREFVIGTDTPLPAAVIYLDGMADKKLISDSVMRPLMTGTRESLPDRDASPEQWFRYIKCRMLWTGDVEMIRDWNELIRAVLSGNAAVLVDGWNAAFGCGTGGGKNRSISEPTTEVVVRGPKDSFTESLEINLTLVRRRVRSPDLQIEPATVGKLTQTNVAIMYIKGIVKEDVVREVRRRIGAIDIDAVLESGYIEELIQDHTMTPFPTLYNTERPDAVAGNILEGRVAIFVDGTPFVLIAPTIIAQFFQSPEDYFSRFDIGSAVRLLRYAAFIVALIGPSIYIALMTFHQEMIPTPLLISIAAQREGVPFPSFIEILLMEVSFEVIREAGVRMPRAVGQAVSIVGALILGQAAVQAGMISAMTVIVVATTGIASFAFPKYSFSNAARLLRFIFIVLAAVFGFLGITLGMIMLIAHLASLRSFGVPYLAPFAPFVPGDQKDTVLRLPLLKMITRPKLISSTNKTRIGPDSVPSPQTSGSSGGRRDADETE
ncbi:spore germination protein [Paenibacillus beijingensis]|uniref:Uncharacterized protein n=1 Tax=Paenibacillus beijingensis TaxID=1126833 RepID=A0A0D5NHW5_9BACL|nr:spore germination protein [Paenibacillus beijingensis]AJY74572.1 hypothetical protein VN24_08295 [Paenibacillus beijingensis]